MESSILKRTERLVNGLTSSSSSSPPSSSTLDNVPSTISSRGNRPEITIRSARGRKDELRDLNNVIFRGVHYSNEYYEDVEAAGFSRLAYIGNELAGAICCYVITKGKEAYRRKEVNVSTIGVYTHFRRKGVGTKLMNEVVDAAIGDPFVTKILLNVHTNDASAISFYKRLGFKVINQQQLIKGSAWVMELTLRKIGQEHDYPSSSSSSSSRAQPGSWN